LSEEGCKRRRDFSGAVEGRDRLVQQAAKPGELPGYLEVGPWDSRRTDNPVEDASAEEALAIRKRLGGREPPLKDAGFLRAEVNDQPQYATAFYREARAAAMSRSLAWH
jgi:hypothetical protein